GFVTSACQPQIGHPNSAPGPKFRPHSGALKRLMAVPTLRDCATLLLKGGVRRFDRNLVMWDIPTHMSTVTADSRRRVPLPVRPGERLDVQTDADGRIILRRLRPTPAEIRKLAPIGK